MPLKKTALKTLCIVCDNFETDIVGAICARQSRFSILVQVGNFEGTGNHDNYPDDKKVNDVYEP